MKAELRPVPHKKAVAQISTLKIRDISKIFHMNDVFNPVLDGISLDIKRGEIVCLLGRSGCGKSTLLKILAGFIPPSSGDVLLNNHPVEAPAPDRCIVFQEDTLFPWLTVEENIAFGLKGKKIKKRVAQKKVAEFLSLVGLSEFKHYLPREISGGMKQRVALARVLILEPEVLLMDEPFASLDAQTREEMQNLLLILWKKFSHTILFVTHDVNEAITLADRVVIIGKNQGRIHDIIEVDLSKPRNKESTGFLMMYRQLSRGLHD